MPQIHRVFENKYLKTEIHNSISIKLVNDKLISKIKQILDIFVSASLSGIMNLVFFKYYINYDCEK